MASSYSFTYSTPPHSPHVGTRVEHYFLISGADSKICCERWCENCPTLSPYNSTCYAQLLIVDKKLSVHPRTTLTSGYLYGYKRSEKSGQYISISKIIVIFRPTHFSDSSPCIHQIWFSSSSYDAINSKMFIWGQPLGYTG